jgi:hypothetical protein
MYPSQPDNTVSQNDPSLGYTPTAIMGNTNFQLVSVFAKSEVQPTFPQMSYISLEGELFFNAMTNPMSSPYTQYGGGNSGQQVVSGQITMRDPTGTSRFQQGFQSVNG